MGKEKLDELLPKINKTTYNIEEIYNNPLSTEKLNQ